MDWLLRERGSLCPRIIGCYNGANRRQRGIMHAIQLDDIDLTSAGISPQKEVFRNLAPAVLIEHALRKEEGLLCDTGALVVNTGSRTGRSAKDKFIVDSPEVHDEIAWGEVNRPISREVFDALYERVAQHLSEEPLYVFDGFAGIFPEHARCFRVIGELASQALFINQLLRRPSRKQLRDFVSGYTVLVAPTFLCDPARDGVESDAAILIDYTAKRALICGTRYAGEIKKCIFSIMNYVLPHLDVLPMHCSANVGTDGDTAIFFGLSGTGKTTLSADPSRKLIGDDEHGWADDMVFNFEGGCYAKCIDLDREHEPDIFDAIKFGALVENVALDPATRHLDFHDNSITENTRAAYPIDHIRNIVPSGMGRVPSTVIFLTADAFGVLPPVSKLTLDQAMYYFLCGYTSKVAGTEVGITDPVPTFSTCFGEPFLPLSPVLYAEMLRERVEATGANVFLINTGWNGKGERISLRATRSMVNAAISGGLDEVEYCTDDIFGLSFPRECPGCSSDILDPRASWADQDAYATCARKLSAMLEEAYARFGSE